MSSAVQRASIALREDYKAIIEKSYCDAAPDDMTNLLIFLSQYRATPNRNAPEGKSPSELFLGTRFQPTLDLLKYASIRNAECNVAMKQAYNK